MDLGTGSLFDLPATVRVEAEKAAPTHVPATPSDLLLAGIRDTQAVIAAQEIVKVQQIVEWAGLAHRPGRLR